MMRSLAGKLVIAFLIVSMVSIAGLAALTHFSTDREFNRFISDQYREGLANALASYYTQNNGWDDLASHPEQLSIGPEPPHARPQFFAVANANGVIVVGDDHHKVGESVAADVLSQSAPIAVNGKTVGYLLLAAPPNRDPVQREFIQRLDLSLLVSAFGAIALALIFGIILSGGISHPIRELTDATRAMADGKLGQHVTVRSHDEVGRLAESFNKMNAELARSLDLRRQMTADIAHELRTPLSLIIAQAEAVHDGVLPPTKDNFEVIREEADRLEKLVDDLRTLSLADAGELSIHREMVDVGKFLREVANRYSAEFAKKNIALEVSPQDDLRSSFDASRFSQVLGNIIENALHYTPSGGRVVMSARKMGEKIEMSVEDSGRGVAPDEAERLFERFYRTDEARARNGGGSGLGLAIARSIVELHGGKISATSEAGRGLKVVIELAW